MRAHASEAADATPTARATSADEPRVTIATTPSLIGERFSNVAPLSDATSTSSIQWRIEVGYIFRPAAARRL
jgi:hypothetical protein